MGPRPFGRGRRNQSRLTGPHLKRFNGAATFRSRKARAAAARRTCLPASMGPRPFGRGRTMSAPPWPPTSRRFNGAATFRSRKARNHTDIHGKVIALQWGRDLSVAEGRGAI